jgi:hypothetical protein
MDNDKEFFRMIDTFVNRLKRIGIELKLGGNWPWLYIDEINGKRVTEQHAGNHGFTLAFRPIRIDQKPKFTDIEKIFELLRKYK